MDSRTLRLVAPAKINLYLAVGQRRSDGYHDVTTILSALDLADELIMSPAPALSVVCEPGLGIPAEDNLAYRAARDLSAVLGREPLAAIEVRKRIPHGAGLGGGSSDAAAVLAGLAAWWGLAPDNADLVSVARDLGVDVAYFLYGGTALFQGRGDVFVRAISHTELPVVIVRSDEPVPTGAAYAAFDRQLQAEPPGFEPMTSALMAGDIELVAARLYNNMTEPSCGLVTGVADALAWVRGRQGVMGVAMAGSGSAVFGVCPDAQTAAHVAEEARSHGWWSVATHTVSHGVRVEDEGGGV